MLQKRSFKTVLGVVAYTLLSSLVFGAECPIIFLHGHQSDPDPSHSWQSWNNSQSAMMKLINAGYGSYTEGSPRDCHKNTSLASTGGNTKKIYNFCYYNPDGSRGAIGSNGVLIPYASQWDPGWITEYNANLANGSWAENLSVFIDKVLTATGAVKVDIVAHSMGGLVAKATGSRRSREVYPREPRSPEVTEDGWGFRQLKGLTAKQNFL